MLRIIVLILTLLFPILDMCAADTTVGEPLQLGFYSRIHNNIDATRDILRKKELSKFKTFDGFGICRGPIPWLDKEPMNESMLIAISQGDLSGLSQLMEKNKTLGTSRSDEFVTLASCLTQTYMSLGDMAAQDESGLSQMGILGIYTDGNTKNSDYDIVDDITKINTILFTEKLDYTGKVNNAKESLTAMSEGTPVQSVVSGVSPDGIPDTSETVDDPTKTLASLGINSICQSSGGTTSVSNITDTGFVGELENILAGGTPPISGTSYTPAEFAQLGDGGGADFFNTPPCSSNFCVRVKMIPGSISLVGGSTYSIESLIDKHTAIMTPIANSNLAAKTMSKNSYEGDCKLCKFKDFISGSLYLEERPQKQKTYSQEYTPQKQKEEFEQMRRCAYVAAGLDSDMHRSNIMGGAGFLPRTGRTTENKGSTTIRLSTENPDDTALASCMDIAMGQSRERYYASLSRDLTELESFTTGLVRIFASAVDEQKALDKKKVQ